MSSLGTITAPVVGDAVVIRAAQAELQLRQQVGVAMNSVARLSKVFAEREPTALPPVDTERVWTIVYHLGSQVESLLSANQDNRSAGHKVLPGGLERAFLGLHGVLKSYQALKSTESSNDLFRYCDAKESPTGAAADCSEGAKLHTESSGAAHRALLALVETTVERFLTVARMPENVGYC